MKKRLLLDASRSLHVVFRISINFFLIAMLYMPGAYWSLYSTNFDFLFSLATISRETLSIPFQDLHITKQCPCNVVELWGKPRVEMSGCCKRCHPMQRVSNFGHLFSPIRNNWVKRNVDLLGMFFCCFFSHAFRLLHVPTSRFDYSACTVIDRTITSRKTATN